MGKRKTTKRVAGEAATAAGGKFGKAAAKLLRTAKNSGDSAVPNPPRRKGLPLHGQTRHPPPQGVPPAIPGGRRVRGRTPV